MKSDYWLKVLLLVAGKTAFEPVCVCVAEPQLLATHYMKYQKKYTLFSPILPIPARQWELWKWAWGYIYFRVLPWKSIGEKFALGSPTW